MTFHFGTDRGRRPRARGFSLVELMVVVVVIAILVALAVPMAINMLHLFRLRNACSEFSGLVQQERSRAVRDSTYYSLYVVLCTPITDAYVDVGKAGAPSSSCTTVPATDPQVSWAPEVQPFPISGGTATPPAQSALQTAFLPTSSAVTLKDGYTNAITFSPMGLPCIANSTTKTCNSASSSTILTAYWMFFQNTTSGTWEAVTVTPAGKVQKWEYSGSSWVQI